MSTNKFPFFVIDLILVILIIIAFSLNWLHYGKILDASGWGIPNLYQKSTNIANTVLFFTKKDSPDLGKFLYLIPAFALITGIFAILRKTNICRFCLLVTSFVCLFFSGYMYYYFISSKLFSLSNCGLGIHFLCVTSVLGIFYSICCYKTK